MELTNILGHIGYIFLLSGMILLARKKIIGWLLRMSGDILWLIVGFLLGMSSIWFWVIIFLCLDIYGYFSWKKKQNSITSSL